MSVKDLKNVLYNHIHSIKALDIFHNDLRIFLNPEEQNYLWIITANNTQVMTKSSVSTSDLLYYINPSKSACYEVDTDTLSATYIENIEQYIERCNVDEEINSQYSIYKDDFDYDFDY